MRAQIEIFDQDSHGSYSETGKLEEIILEDGETVEDVLKKVKKK